MPNGYDDLIERAVKGYQEVDAMSPEQLKAWLHSFPLLPPSIPLGHGQHQFITSDGESALRELGSLWFENNPGLATQISRNVVENQAVCAFGDLIMDQTLPGDANIRPALVGILKKRVEAGFKREHFYFPVQLFDQQDVPSLNVGPVSFLRREDWISRVRQVAAKSFPWTASVLKAWASVTKRKSRNQQARNVLEFVGTCPWVAAISIDGRDKSRAVVCARVAVVVALDGLALPLDAKGARSFRGPGDQREAQLTHSLSQSDGRDVTRSFHLDLPRLGGKPGFQADYIQRISVLRDAVGNALHAFINVNATGAVKLKRRWVEAMYWFGQARREDDEFIGLVKIGVALDVLAKGGKAGGITRLCKQLFGVQESTPVSANGPTLQKLIKDIYDEGRSQIAHGGKLALLHELPVFLGLADNFASVVLIEYVLCLAKYTGPDEYDDFFAALPSLRSKP